MMSELLNTVNDVQESNVEAQTPAEVEGVTAAPETPEVPPQEAAKPAQSAEENALFAKIRREAESRAAETLQKQKDEFFKAQFAGQRNPFTGAPIENEADFREYERQQVLNQFFERTGVPAQEQEALLKKVLLGLPEYQQTAQEAEKAKQDARRYLDVLVQQKMSEDLAAIKKAYPKETAKSVVELGPTYTKLIDAEIEPLTAYEMVLKERQRQAPPPPSMGDINNAGADEAEYYTLEQLKAMSQKEMHKNWTKVEKSRQHIFK